MKTYIKLFRHEILSFFRSPNFAVGLIFKFIMGFGMLYLAAVLLMGGILLPLYVHDELQMNPAFWVSQWFLYAWVADLTIRSILQGLPTNNIMPYLSLNITKNTLVKYIILKTFLSIYNWIYILIFLPFLGALIYFNYSFLSSLSWIIALWAMMVFNNFLTILFQRRKIYILIFLAIIGTIFYLEYQGLISIRPQVQSFFYTFYEKPIWTIIPVILLAAIIYVTYQYILKSFYLDAGLKQKENAASNQKLDFLGRFGVLGIFLKNDIRLILRNKYPRQILLNGLFFLFYGLLVYYGKSYDTIWFKFLAGIVLTGGFSLTYGAKVPSWDSSYYQLMMTQNVPYKKYLEAKWWLMVIATAITIILAGFYAFLDVEFYFIILVAGIYNLGVNSHITLLGGAFLKTPVDLNAKTKAFGDKSAWNWQNMLLTIPKMLFPMLVFFLLYNFVNSSIAILTIAILGILGFLLRDKVFDLIIKTYKKEKYMTLHAFKNNS